MSNNNRVTLNPHPSIIGKPAGALPVGDIFIYEGFFYIRTPSRTASATDIYCAVNLHNGNPATIQNGNGIVTPVEKGDSIELMVSI